VLTFTIRRVLFALFLIWVVASAAFVLTRLAPGDVTFVDGPLTSADQRAAARAQLGLDRPLPTQYGAWLAGVLRLDFGTSLLYNRPIGPMLAERAANTAILATAALLLATLLGIPAGIYSGTHVGGLGAALTRGVSIVLLSTPSLIASLLLVLVATRTGWLPPGGMTSMAGSSGWISWFGDVLHHLPVPTLALALPLAATLERLQSQALVEASARPFVAAARARGLSAAEAVARHAWPASLGPVLGIYGLMIGSLLSGSFVVEAVTAWPGLGRLMVDALVARDLYLVAGAAAAGATGLAMGTLATDLLHAWVDPRVREGR
jgi:peptide/nickel transport system permease protein